MTFVRHLAFVLACCIAMPAAAQPSPPAAPQRPALGPVNLSEPIVTRREGTFHGRRIAY